MVMKRLAGLASALALFGLPAGSSLAINPGTAGQPSETCLAGTSTALEPGNAAAARGSAFNESGPGVAGTVYAGNGANTNTPANGHAVSQYDVACFQFTAAHS
jgi:hypothetical protein